MFNPWHINLNGYPLCHSTGFIVIDFAEVEGTNPAMLCDDCLRRYKNITGLDLKKQPIDKALLRAKINTL